MENAGKGFDRKGGKRDGIKWRWLWVRVCDRSWSEGDPQLHDKRRLPCQSCYADLPRLKSLEMPGITLSTVRWTSRQSVNGYDYQGSVMVGGDQMLISPELDTRLEAQKAAEKLLRQFCRETVAMLRKA